MPNPNATAGAAGFTAFDRRARAGEPLTVAFLGGSLTWGANASDPQRTSYRGLMGVYLQQRYPACPFTFRDAAIGGTGSQLGLFRLDRDVLSCRPALVFLDFTANDNLTGDDRPPLLSYETILRELIGHGVPVVQVLLGFRDNFGAHSTQASPPRRRDHLALAAAYHTGVGDTFPFIQGEVDAGRAQLEQLWPFDGIHPDDAGYRLFFEGVRLGFEAAVAGKLVCQLPGAPVFGAYRQRTRHRLAGHALPPGWTRASTYRTAMWFDGQSSRWMDDVAVCAGGQPLRVPFSGNLVGIFGEADGTGCGFRAAIDGRPVPYPASAGEAGAEIWPFDTRQLGGGRLFVWRVLASDLPPGDHLLEITPVAAAQGELRIESICSAGE